MSLRSSDAAAGRTKVAVLGGGCGGLAAACALTATPELQASFDVTVYQMGHRLGGKGASGRAPHADGAGGFGQRIEEHGLHIWFGFYAHAFSLLRQAYEEAGLASGDRWWETPFQKCDAVSLYELTGSGWVREGVRFPSRSDSAGPPTELGRPPFARLLAAATRRLATGLRGQIGDGVVRRGLTSGDPAVEDAAAALDDLAEELDRGPGEAGADGETPVTRGIFGQAAGFSVSVIEGAIAKLRSQVEALANSPATRERLDQLHLWRGGLDMIAAAFAGIVTDGVLIRGLDVIDDRDLREWLGQHGADPATVERSPLLRGLYDLTFSYADGDKRRPSLAAGKGLQSMLMMINYDGAFMWRMRAGMGDVVFSPLYLALKQRGVRFEFFSRITRLGLGPAEPHNGGQPIERIELVREATVAAGVDQYDPLEQFGDWWCWPADPLESQLSDRSERPETLVRGEHFDDVVLAIPVGAQPEICAELAAASPRYKQMLDGSRTVRTKGLQLWLTKSVAELHARPRADGLDPPATAYAEPFDTYCDMSHLLAPEGFGDMGPRGVAYFCAVLPDEIAESEVEGQVRAQSRAYIEQHARAFWPGAFDGEEFDWNVLYDPEGRVGPDRLEAQYLRANVHPSDRYVTTPAGSVESRLDPGDSGFENLVLAGDWTHNVIDGGCVEAAVISGERAGEALIDRASGTADFSASPPAPSPAASPAATAARGLPRYVEYGALATAPGPLMCEAARLYCFFVKGDRDRVQALCDRVLQAPTGGALRYKVPQLAPVVLSFGSIGGLRSLDPTHSGRGSAFEPEAAIWIPTIAQHRDGDDYIDGHVAVFMPYIWVDDPIAFAAGREVYGFAKTQGWLPNMGDPRKTPAGASGDAIPDPPDELYLDVYGTERYATGSELGQKRLVTVRHAGATRGLGEDDQEEARLAALFDHALGSLDPGGDEGGTGQVTRGLFGRVAGMVSLATSVGDFFTEKVIHHVFLKQFRDAEDGDAAVLQQVVEAQSTVVPGTLRWRRLPGAYDLEINELVTQPLQAELGIDPQQRVRLGFAAEFGFRMEQGQVLWPPDGGAHG